MGGTMNNQSGLPAPPPLPPATLSVPVQRSRWKLRVILSVAIVLLVVIVVGILAWPALSRWQGRSSAASLASGVGLQLSDDDRVVYGEVYSAFPDSTAFLVVEVDSPERRDVLLRTSRMPQSVQDDADRYASSKAVAHGLQLTTPVMRSVRPEDSRGTLSAVWNPQISEGTRLYVYAGQV